MNKYEKILKQYWGYQSFRPLQTDIIQSVCDGKDTLALMPTGGGKSLTFQVPAIANNGICIVVTPLIALMKDQVEALKKIGIKALSVHSGMTAREIDITLDNAVYGDYKFLYLSPERLETEIFRVRVQKMNVSLIAVDEAHCISQWGYDFRPSYLNIAEVRKLLPDVPVLALTATATEKVAEDIMAKLCFKKPNLLKKSFERENLIYIVRELEDKYAHLLRVLQKQPGSAIVYVRSRAAAKEIAAKLHFNGISADYYHAGLSMDIRNVKQKDWMTGVIRVIVATNAFGMGIDKPDVRSVIHMDLPDSLEAYFQEAGRAGRDGLQAYAVLLYNNTDKVKFEQRFRTEFPEITKIKEIYSAACNYLQIPYGAGKGMAYDFNLTMFSYQYKYYPSTVVSAFKFLQNENIAELTENFDSPSRISFIVSRDDLYRVQIKNADLDRFIKALLRAYTGLFSGYVNIDENYLAHLLHMKQDDVYVDLVRLRKMKVIDFIPRKHTSLIIMHEERLDARNIRISAEHYNIAKERYIARVEAMAAYAQTNTVCRSIQLLLYFGQKNAEPCGKCDVCKEYKQALTKAEIETVADEVRSILKYGPLMLSEVTEKSQFSAKTVTDVFRNMLDNNEIMYHGDNKYTVNK